MERYVWSQRVVGYGEKEMYTSSRIMAQLHEVLTHGNRHAAEGFLKCNYGLMHVCREQVN